LILSPAKSNSPDIADPDGTDAEYMGTYSLGPVSLAVIPSVAEDAGMTDSLLANPDLDARESELGDELDLAGSVAATGSSSPPRVTAFDSPLPGNLCGRIEPKQAPEFLEAALLPPSLSVPSYTTGCDSSTKELYSVPATDDGLQSDTDDLFAYHIRPGLDLSSSTATSAMQQRNPQFAIPERSQQNFTTPSVGACLSVSPVGQVPGRSTVSSHAVLRLTPQPTRPTLPEIAPVSLPDFAQPPNTHIPAAVQPSQTDTNSQSDYDNVCTSTRQRPSKSANLSTKHGCAAVRKLAAVARHRANRWQSLTPGDESDAMSGYIGDAASSVYDTGEDDDDDDGERGSTNDRCDVTQLYIPHPPSEPIYGKIEVDSNRNFPNRSTSAAVAATSPPVAHNSIGQNMTSNGHTDETTRTVPVPTKATSNGSGTRRATLDTAVSLQPTAQTNFINVHRTPSSAGSQTSGPEMRSEYDNVETGESSNEAHMLKQASPKRKTRVRSTQQPGSHRVASMNAKRSEITQRLFDAQIAAEARRISRQFRAMGWLPAASAIYSPVAQRSPTEQSLIFGRFIHYFTVSYSILFIHRMRLNGSVASPNPGQKPLSLARPHLFLLPMDVTVSNPCSRQTSFRDQSNPGAIGVGVGGASMLNSETMTTVTSQFDEDDEEELDEFAPRYGQHLNGAVARLNTQHNENGFHDMSSDSDICGENTKAGPEKESVPFLLVPDAVQTTMPEPICEQLGLLEPAVRRESRRPRISTSPSPEHQNNQVSGDPPAAKRSGVSPGLTRLQRRAARVRSLIPPELLPYIMPSCMSSPSRSSSMISSAFGQSGVVFLSLARSRRSRRKIDRMKRDRFVESNANRRCCTSDPELNLICR
uniref:BRCT domain-containing protein n=1 Tax=Echinostoma caproni TaxID=27848 RepID=A0A183AXI9_9TREM